MSSIQFKEQDFQKIRCPWCKHYVTGECSICNHVVHKHSNECLWKKDNRICQHFNAYNKYIENLISKFSKDSFTVKKCTKCTFSISGTCPICKTLIDYHKGSHKNTVCKHFNTFIGYGHNYYSFMKKIKRLN